MKDNGLLIINGIRLPDPTEMSLSEYDISDSERNANGIMVSQIIRTDIQKVECKWAILRESEYALIRNAISRKFGLSVTYRLAGVGTQTKTMYVGDRKTPIYTYAMGEPVYKNVSMNFTEM